jgi:5-formaminoimidazole-4-carboxamide-1-(beta)-D-ribofuranosyl 5'-monophosphate synthetase
MISLSSARSLVRGYGSNVKIAALASHSALEIFDGAKDEGFQTVALCQRGREKTYSRYRRIIDEIIVLGKYAEMLQRDIQRKLRSLHCILIPHRSLTAYLGYDLVENKLRLPIFGNRAMLRMEERTGEFSQYSLLDSAHVSRPRLFKDASQIDRPVLIKVMEARRGLERAFFIATSKADFEKKTAIRLKEGIINREGLSKAAIEEFLLGTYFNFNFFYSPLEDEVELIGVDRRLQTNIHDYASLPAREQLELDVPLQNIEVGHMAASVRESLLEKMYDAAERVLLASKRISPPGIIGPFTLQSVVNVDLEIVVYDVSLRVPGSPMLTVASPYSRYRYGEVVGVGRRIAMELKEGLKQNRIEELVT